MKFLHLADLHLGKRVNGFDLLEDQRYILEQILALCDSNKVDAVVLAGDIYDAPVPPATACTLLDWFLTQLAARRIAVLENIVAYGIDVLKWTRKKAVTVNFVLVFLLSLPCALGFNVLSGIQPFGPGSMILDLEDFIVSNNLLPLGSMVFLFFCCYKRGWGWDNFIAEADTGKGLMFPKGLRLYVKYVLPFIVFFVFVQGYIDKFFK